MSKPGSLPSLQFRAVHDKERGARGDRRCRVGHAGQRVAERPCAVDCVDRTEQAFDDCEVGLSFGDAGLDHGLRIALLRSLRLGVLERGGQGPRLQALGFELGGRAVTFGGERVVHLFLEPRGCVRRGLFQFRAQAGRRVGRGLFQLGS